jgi:hypothetical protein
VSTELITNISSQTTLCSSFVPAFTPQADDIHNIGCIYSDLIGHENSYVTELRNPLNVRRRLKRQWPSDLKDQREEEE